MNLNPNKLSNNFRIYFIAAIIMFSSIIFAILNPHITSASNAVTTQNRTNNTLATLSIENAEKKVVRVGFPSIGGMSQVDENGNYSGYTYEYLMEISQYTGWDYEFVEVPGNLNTSLNTLLDMLSSGEIDILGGLSKTEATMNLWDFPEYNYGYSYRTLCCLDGNYNIDENNFKNIKGLRIAVIKGAEVTNGKIKNFCENNNIDYTFVESAGEAEMIEAVRNNKADLIINHDQTPIDGLRTVVKFDGSPFYFATTKGNTEVLSAINSAISTIQQVKPFFDSTLYEKYFSSDANHLYLSDTEKNYILSAQTIRIAILKNMNPIQFMDENGIPDGIGPDILDTISDGTGLKFEFIPVNNLNEAYSLLKDGNAEAVCGIPYDYKLAQDHNLILSNSFLSAQTVLVTRAGQSDVLSGKTAAVIEGMQNSESTEQNVKVYDSPESCIKAIESGAVDYTYLNLYTAEYLSRNSKHNLVLVPQSGESKDFCIGISKAADKSLLSIINKAIYNIPTDDVSSIVHKNTTSNSEKITLIKFVEQNPFVIIGIITMIFVVLISVSLFIMYLKVRANKRIAFENRRYMQLYELANEYIYEYDYKHDYITFTNEFSELFGLPKKIEHFAAAMRGNLRSPEELNPDIFRVFQESHALGNGSMEHTCLLANGELRWFRNTRTIIFDKNAKPLYAIGKLIDIQNEREEKERLEQRASKDGLTGIYNSISVKTFIGERLKNLRKPGALLIIDLDKFKDVNDTLGHYTGDIVLKDFAQLLTESTSNWDICGRLGGDEFMIYIDNAEIDEIIAFFCDNLCKKARRTYFNSDGVSHNITISMGVVIIHKPCEFNDAYQAADKELYNAKRNGRDRYSLSEIAEK